MLWPPRPTFTVEDAVEACNAGCTDEADVRQLLRRLPDLQKTEATYLLAAEASSLYFLLHREREEQESEPDAALLIKAYNSGLVGRAAGRVIYDALKASAVQGKCPLCGLGEIGSLDHHAPKTLFPLLAITPLNLVPACSICNSKKSNSLPSSHNAEDLHPYFDDLGSDRWLFAEIHDGAATFRALPPSHWPIRQTKRLLHHFYRYDLHDRYARFASGLIADRQRTDGRLRDCSSELLRVELQDAARSYEANDPNSWSTALLYALAESDWYLDPENF
ncbi:hypothetical protein OG590_39920 (plasmid) [Streptomyces goshikiensis]|uniref:hypothetical protein n=1 Tax=Streptomyces goshikiensis TaxID=1942 RepID=UPI002F9126C9|nr:hypothetical protein OG590_39920 [Streptomyces goshikiensis]